MVLVIFNIFIILLSLICLIGFHEWGHCWTAKRLGIAVERFSIGFGKPLWIKKARDGTEYVVCIFPLGGYVKFQDQSKFDASPLWKRLGVYAAGPVFNLIFAFLAYWLVFVIGITQVVPRIEGVVPDSPAAKSVVLPGSEILAIDHHPTTSWAAVVFWLLPHLGKASTQLTLTLSHLNHSSDYLIELKHWKLDPLKPDLLKSVGLIPVHSPDKQQMRLRQFSAIKAVPAAIEEIYHYLQFNLIILGKILTGVISLQSLAGPVTLFSGTVSAAHQGFVIYMAFLGFVSVSLAFMNLLPIPGLDGGHILYLMIEMIRGKPLAMDVQVLLFRLGVILLSVLMFQALMNDLVRIV